MTIDIEMAEAGKAALEARISTLKRERQRLEAELARELAKAVGQNTALTPLTDIFLVAGASIVGVGVRSSAASWRRAPCGLTYMGRRPDRLVRCSCARHRQQEEEMEGLPLPFPSPYPGSTRGL